LGSWLGGLFVLALLGAAVFGGYKTFVNPSYDPDIGASRVSTKDCLEDKGLDEDDEVSEALRPTRGSALGVNTASGPTAVIFFESEADAQRGRVELAELFTQLAAEGGLSADETADLQEGIQQERSLILYVQPGVNEPERAAVAECAWEISTNRWSDWIGLDLKQIGRPFARSDGDDER
jgi:hypothetical protein